VFSEQQLLDGAVRNAGILDLRLLVRPELVSLTTAAGETLASAVPGSVERRLDDLLWRLERARVGGSSAEVAHRLRLAGEALGEVFCPAPVGDTLVEQIRAAARPVRLGIRADDARLADLPWEACVVPGQPRALALEPGLELYRDVVGGSQAAAEPTELGAPLRILVAIAMPDDGPPLDLEAEVARVHEALGSSQRGADSRVRLLSRGTLSDLAQALAEETFHIVHISCHAVPGELIMEDEFGRARRVTARELTAAVASSRPVPMIVLSGCSTALGVVSDGGGRTAAALPGLGRELVAAGIPAVLAMTAPVTDDFAPRLAEHFYRGLATSAEPEPLTVLSAARRALESTRLEGPFGGGETELVEWATPALFLGGPSRPLFHRGDQVEPDAPRPTSPAAAPLVGRRLELRALVESLGSFDGPHVVIHGIEGIGKSRLAQELVRLVRVPGVPVVTVTGSTNAEAIVAALPGEGRPATLLCDGFEPNIVRLGPGRFAVRDERLAGVLDGLLRQGTAVTTVFTSRYPFALGHGLQTATKNFQPWLLDDVYSKMMMFRLPALNVLPDSARADVLATIGGHPRALERLETLLQVDEDVTRAMVACIDLLTQECDLGRKLAELDETALSLLLDASVHRVAARERAVLARPSHLSETVYGEALRVLVAEGLIVRQGSTREYESTFLVPRWIAAVLEGRCGEQALAEAHRKAAFTIRADLEDLAQEVETAGPAEGAQPGTAREIDLEWRVQARAQLLTAAHYHHHRAGETLYAHEASNRLVEIWTPRGRWRELERMHYENLRWLPPEDRDVGSAHQALAHIYLARGDIDGAQEHAEAALGVYERVGDRPRAAAMRHALAVVDERRGRFSAAAERCEAALELAADTDAPEVVAACHALLGNIAAHTGDDVGVQEHYRRAMAIWLELGDEHWGELAVIFRNLATVHIRRGEHQEAAEVLRSAEMIYQHNGDVHGYAGTYHSRGLIAQATRDEAAARAYFREVVRLRESLDNHSDAADGYHELGILANDRGDLDGASAYHRKAMFAYREAGNQVGVGLSLHELSLVASKRGDLSQARDLAERALKIKDAAAARPSLPATLVHLGDLLKRQGDSDEALAHYGRAAELSEELGLLETLAYSHRALGRIALDQWRLDEAKQALERALAVDRRRARPDDIIRDLLLLAQVQLFQGDSLASASLSEQCLELARGENDQRRVAQAHNLVGLAALVTQDLAKARVQFNAALELAEAMADGHNIAGSLRNLANVDYIEGDLDESFARYKRAQEIFSGLAASREIASGHHELAAVHRRRGELDEALARLEEYATASAAAGDAHGYVEARHEMAEIITDLARGTPAVQTAVEAFMIGVALSSPHLGKVLDLLLRQRAMFGEEAFGEIMEAILPQGGTAARVPQLVVTRMR